MRLHQHRSLHASICPDTHGQRRCGVPLAQSFPHRRGLHFISVKSHPRRRSRGSARGMAARGALGLLRQATLTRASGARRGSKNLGWWGRAVAEREAGPVEPPTPFPAEPLHGRARKRAFLELAIGQEELGRMTVELAVRAAPPGCSARLRAAWLLGCWARARGAGPSRPGSASACRGRRSTRDRNSRRHRCVLCARRAMTPCCWSCRMTSRRRQWITSCGCVGSRRAPALHAPHADAAPAPLQLCKGEGELAYKGTTLHKVVKGFVVVGGDVEAGDGSGGHSALGSKYFEDENFAGRHSARGVVSMANSGIDSNSSQFLVTGAPLPQLDGRNVAFGVVVDGLDLLDQVEEVFTVNGKPVTDVRITDCGEA